MWPPSINEGEMHWMKAYCKASGHVLPTPILNPEIDSVALKGSEINYNTTFPTLTYIRPLILSSIDTFNLDADQRIVWAVSSIRPRIHEGTLGLQFHDKGHGTAVLKFSHASLVDGQLPSNATRTTELIHSRRHDVLITLHATLLTIAWALCAPAAIFLAFHLRQKDSSKWIKVHWLLQMVTLTFTILGTLCATLAVGSGSHFDTDQKRLGFCVVFGMLAQAFEGYLIHRSASKRINSTLEAGKPVWNHVHRFCGWGLLVIAWATIAFGIKEWEFLGRGTPISVSVLIVITCSVFVLLYTKSITCGTLNNRNSPTTLKISDQELDSKSSRTEDFTQNF